MICVLISDLATPLLSENGVQVQASRFGLDFEEQLTFSNKVRQSWCDEQR